MRRSVFLFLGLFALDAVLGSLLGPLASADPEGADCTFAGVDCAALAGLPGDAALLERVNERWRSLEPSLGNPRYVVLFDASARSDQKRFYLIDREHPRVERYLVAHGRGSDPDHDGYATIFSDKEGSKATSLGFYVTAERYTGRHGPSLKLDGLDPTNAHARERAIVVHGADYVAPGRKVLGRSWGCPALEQDVVLDVIERIKGGALFYIYD